jgi:hypothetical protein
MRPNVSYGYLDRRSYDAPMSGLGDWISRNADVLSFAFGVVGVVSLALSVIFFIKQRRPKTLDYAIISEHSIGVGADQQMPSYLDFSWKVPVDPHDPHSAFEMYTLKSPRITQLLIKNTGKKAIEDRDFRQPIKVSVPEGCWLVDLSTIEASYEAIIDYGPIDPELPYNPKAPATVQIAHGQPNRAFRPALLNAGDWIKMQVLTDGTSEAPIVTSWITDQSRPMRLRPDIIEDPIWEVAIQRLKEADFVDAIKKLAGVLVAAAAVVIVIVWLQT